METTVVAVGDNKMDVLATVQEALGDVPCYITQVTTNGLRRVRVAVKLGRCSLGCSCNSWYNGSLVQA